MFFLLLEIWLGKGTIEKKIRQNLEFEKILEIRAVYLAFVQIETNLLGEQLKL